jgi:hypothetical protein
MLAVAFQKCSSNRRKIVRVAAVPFIYLCCAQFSHSAYVPNTRQIALRFLLGHTEAVSPLISIMQLSFNMPARDDDATI